MNTNQRRTWAEVCPEQLVRNMNAIRASLPATNGDKPKFLAVVKADAYGHGAVQAARALEAGGADYLAVACPEEALELRDAGVTLPILILGPTGPEWAPELLEHRITQAVGSPEMARAFSAAAEKAGKKLRVHIKLDTGMSRTGFDWRDTAALVTACGLPGLEPEGIFTHFARSDVPEDPESEAYTREQLRRFRETISALAWVGIRFPLRHCANTGGVLYYPEDTVFDMVRPGILLYGYEDARQKLSPDLKPCMRLMSRIAAVKTYPAGTAVGYGGTFVTGRETRMGVVPAGYADGLHRVLSNRCAFYVAGGFAPQRGRICMDMCMIDLTELPEAKVGDTVEIFGEHARLETLAEAAGTITYELLCAVSPRVPRVYI